MKQHPGQIHEKPLGLRQQLQMKKRLTSAKESTALGLIAAGEPDIIIRETLNLTERKIIQLRERFEDLVARANAATKYIEAQANLYSHLELGLLSRLDELLEQKDISAPQVVSALNLVFKAGRLLADKSTSNSQNKTFSASLDLSSYAQQKKEA